MKAIWNGEVLAESDETIQIEGHHYFPVEKINQKYFSESDTHTTCMWKGVASYYTIKVGDKENRDAAWYYPDPSNAAKPIKNHVAFWRGVEIVQ